jgi:hypothetical protein
VWWRIGLGAIAGALASWLYWSAQMSDLERDVARDKQSISDEYALSLESINTEYERKAKEGADIDKREYEKLTNAQENLKRLNADLSSSNLRLSVKAKCPANSASVPSSISTARLDDAEVRAEISQKDAGTILGIASDGDDAIIRHNALIDWINSQK